MLFHCHETDMTFVCNRANILGIICRIGGIWKKLSSNVGKKTNDGIEAAHYQPAKF